MRKNLFFSCRSTMSVGANVNTASERRSCPDVNSTKRESYNSLTCFAMASVRMASKCFSKLEHLRRNGAAVVHSVTDQPTDLCPCSEHFYNGKIKQVILLMIDTC